MIMKVEEIPVTKTSYPFANAEKLVGLQEKGYVEKEYYMYGTANVYRSVDNEGTVEVKTPDAPYVNRLIVRAPQKPEECSGNVVVEIINPTAFMEIDRMWILGYREFLRNGDIYVGITSKPNTIPKLLEFDGERYGKLSWKNPSEAPFPFDPQEIMGKGISTPDLDISYETGLFWDMLTDLAWMLREGDGMSPLKGYPAEYIYLTGWSQSACYMIRYVNSFAYRPEVKRDGCVFDGYLAAGAPRRVVTPVSQYEADHIYPERLHRIEWAEQPYIALQTETENGRYNTFRVRETDSDSPDFLYRIYDIAGASHDTMYSCVNYYREDEDMKRIGVLPSYPGKQEGNDYPSQILCAAAYRNLFRWVREGIGPRHCEKIKTDACGENRKDALGNSIGGLRTCLIDFPTGNYSNISEVEKGTGNCGENMEKTDVFGSQRAFSGEMLREMYGSLEQYRKLAERHTAEQVSRGFVCREDAEELVRIAVELAEKRGLK